MKKLTLIAVLCIGAYLYYSDKVNAENATSEQPESKIEQVVKTEVEEKSAVESVVVADGRWSELPEKIEGDFLKHKTYYTTLCDGSRVRNYSICYDTRKMVSLWVAYPLHKVYTTPKIDRTDAWAYDDAVTAYGEGGYDIIGYEITEPKIEQYFQPNVKAGGFNDGENRKLDRGHMLPSASRYNSWQTNAQTFYATNMMPQHSQFNQKIWATLESDVRGWSCADTLFVVTGTLYEGSIRTISARGRKIAVPSHAYKLVLRTKGGNTKKHIANIKSADEIKCIGFLFENNGTGAATSIRNAAVSVAEIERRSGFKFFRNLNPEIADEVKSQKNLSDWGI